MITNQNMLAAPYTQNVDVNSSCGAISQASRQKPLNPATLPSSTSQRDFADSSIRHAQGAGYASVPRVRKAEFAVTALIYFFFWPVAPSMSAGSPMSFM